MTITLSPETQAMLERRMALNHINNPDDAIHAAFLVMDDLDRQEDDRNPETLAAIRRGLAQAEAGLSRPWAEVEADLIARRRK